MIYKAPIDINLVCFGQTDREYWVFFITNQHPIQY
jgi:hypothetical protein